jgi:hypothetical protein
LRKSALERALDREQKLRPTPGPTGEQKYVRTKIRRGKYRQETHEQNTQTWPETKQHGKQIKTDFFSYKPNKIYITTKVTIISLLFDYWNTKIDFLAH